MLTQTEITVVVVSQEAEDVIRLGRKKHWRFRLIPDFYGPLDQPTFNLKGDWIYYPKTEEDNRIIPKAAFKRHLAVAKAGHSILQVVIGHEIRIAKDEPNYPPNTGPEIDWKIVAEDAARGVLAGMAGIALVSLYALTGVFQLADPSYCIVLNDGMGTVIELMSWNTEV